jgi:hypothetical protein
MACETICKPVDAKLDDIWSGVKARPTTLTFYLIISGLGGLCILLLMFLWTMKGEMGALSNQVTQLIGSVQIVQTQLTHTNENLKLFGGLIDRENQRQDARLERLENKVETLHKLNGGVNEKKLSN